MSLRVRRMWLVLTADRRRFGLLCAVCVVGLLLWGRLIVVSRPPRMAVANVSVGASAGAAPRSQGESDASAASSSVPLNGDGRIQSTGATRTGGAGNRGAADKSIGGDGGRAAIVRLWSVCARDPFVIGPAYGVGGGEAALAGGEGLESSMEVVEDEGAKESRLRRQDERALAGLRLEGVMGGTMAVVGGRRYVAGDRLEPAGVERVKFTLVEVRERSIVLETEGRRYEVWMSLPGQERGSTPTTGLRQE